MKFTHLKLAALLLLGSSSALLASISPTQTYEFQYVTSDSGFAPTYVWVTAALNTESSAAASILKYQITTPEGVWTQDAFQPSSGSLSAIPIWDSGTVEVSNGGNTLTFLSTANLDGAFNQPNSFFGYNVQLTTTTVSDTTFLDVPNGSDGVWTPVPTDSPVSEASDTFVMLLGAVMALGAWHQFQRHGALGLRS